MTKKNLFTLFVVLSFYFGKAQFATLHNFGNSSSDGLYPHGSLVTDGTFLYGMTYGGGSSTFGTIFKVKPDGTGYLRLMSFVGASTGRTPYGSLIFDGTFLYGMTSSVNNTMGTVFKILPSGSGYVKLLDFNGTLNGSNPMGSLFFDGVFLYGMTREGGTSNLGVIFKIKPDGTGYIKLKDFTGMPDGQYPEGSLVSDGTFLYGMTYVGGINNSTGTLFKIMPDGSGYTKLLDFMGSSNGANPSGSLIFDGTYLYGMTQKGGANNTGVIFKILGDGTNYTKLFDFTTLSNGWRPYGDLVSTGNFLYGMTRDGGTTNDGVFFKIKPDGTGFTKILDFAPNSFGANPEGSLIYNGGSLFGMTSLGGQFSQGKIFKYDGIVNVEENFKETDLLIFPNPNNGEFTIQIKGSYNEYKIEVYNLLSEVIYEKNISSSNHSINDAQEIINLSFAPSGIYSVFVKNNNGTSSKKIIIAK